MQVYHGAFKSKFPISENPDQEEDENIVSVPVPRGRKKISDLAECTVPETWGSPLEYMLSVMNDPNVDDDRRDRMAQAAAPFVHARLPSTLKYKSKKDMMNEMAKGAGEAWSELLTNGENPSTN